MFTYRNTGVVSPSSWKAALGGLWGGAPARLRSGAVPAAAFALFVLLPQGFASAASDPGVRGGPPGAGGALPGLTPEEEALFDAGAATFLEVDGVAQGLGPRFNLDSCAGCHAQPAPGGTSPVVNPQVAAATRGGARNVVPWFVSEDGPVREARYKRKADGTRDGGVTDLFVITGRSDAPGCAIAQPDYGAAGDPLTGRGGNPNVVFRIPTPTFGAGLIESIPDAAILANKRARSFEKLLLGISGKENRTGNDGTITRFGWKAQNSSLLVFAGEAYNVEQGVTNELFTQERDEDPECQYNPLTEDRSSFAANPAEAHSDVVQFAAFMRLLAPPAPAPETRTIAHGRQLFDRVGCALCHTPTLTTGRAAVAALSQKPVNLYSDLLLHDMGRELADDVVQGAAGPDEFRTAPLWGLGQRIFFFHDGRTRDLVKAIEAHGSPGSEANAVVRRFDALRDGDKQDVLDFLRSL